MLTSCQDFFELSSEILRKGALSFQVRGGSMRPSLRTGDNVFIEPCDMNMVKRGDIVFFKKHDRLLCVHRVLSVMRDKEGIRLLVKGDAVPHPDGVIDEGALLGRAVAFERAGRHYRFDSLSGRACSLLWAHLSKFSFFFYPAARFVKFAIGGFLRLGEKRACEEVMIALAGRRADIGDVCRVLSRPRLRDYFLRRVFEEKTGPLIYKALKKQASEAGLSLPGVWGDIEKAYYTTAARNTLLMNELSSVLNLFEQNSVPAIAFKGLILGELVYGDLGVRPTTDSDLLIRKKDLQRADALLRGSGYRPQFSIRDLGAVTYSPSHNSVLYAPPDGSLQYVHLYWHLLNLFPYERAVFEKFDIEKIWSCARPASWSGGPVLRMSPPHEFLYLCMHAFKHAFMPFILVCDLDRWLTKESEGFDWERLIREASDLGLSKYLYYGLFFLSRFFGPVVPEGVMAEVKPKAVSMFEKKFIQAVVRRHRESAWMNPGLVSFGMNETWAGRARYLKGAVFPSREEMAVIRQKDAAAVRASDYIRRLLGSVRA